MIFKISKCRLSELKREYLSEMAGCVPVLSSSFVLTYYVILIAIDAKEFGNIAIRFTCYDSFVIITIVTIIANIAIISIVVICTIVAIFISVAIADISECLFSGDIGIPNDSFTQSGDCEESIAIEWIQIGSFIRTRFFSGRFC